MTPEEIEIVAEECHRQWAGWTSYLLSKMTGVMKEEDRKLYLIMDAVWADRWNRQINMPYADLSEEEKGSDRREAIKILIALESHHA